MRRTFRHVGGEITNEFLMSLGYLPGAHTADCPVRTAVLQCDPPWRQVGEAFYD